MFERFATDMRRTVMTAAQEATVRRGENRIGTDHLLVGLVAAGNDVATAAGLSVEGLYDGLDRLDEKALGSVGLAAHAHLLRPGGWRRRHHHLPFTEGAKSALRRSLLIAIDHRHRSITTDHLLAGLAVGGPRDRAVKLLRACWVEPADIEAAARRSIDSGAA